MNTMIIKYIAELMYDCECVIIPEFGAFISKESPARLDYAVHRLSPPSKEFVFNAKLKNEDDVLADYLCEKLHITHQKAVMLLHDFAMQSLAKLEVDKEMELEGIGKLYYVNSQIITFVQNDNVNFNGNSFGLGTFSIQPVFRSEIYSELKTEIEERQREKNVPMTVAENAEEMTPHKVTRANYKWYRAAAYSSIVATAMVLLGWGVDANNSKLASWNPLFYSSPNEFVVKHLNEKYNARETYIVDQIKPTEVKLPIASYNPEIVVEHRAKKTIKQEVAKDYYSIIGASFNDMASAERCVEKFKKLGFGNAEVLPERKGRYRVEYEAVAGKEAAVERLEVIKKEYNESAWLLIKKY